MNLKQTALASALVAGLTCWAGAHAYILGPGSEGLLVPAVLWSNLAPLPTPTGTPPLDVGDPPCDAAAGDSCFESIVDTVVYLHTMGSLLKDVVPQNYTAPNVAKAGGPDYGRTCNVDANGDYNFKGNGDLEFNDQPCDQIHWMFFDYTSKHRLDDTIPVTPDDKYVFSWAKEAAGNLEGVPGYLVFLTESGAQGNAANFIMAADAVLRVAWAETEIPVFGLADGDDAAAGDKITRTNNCVSEINGKVVDCSPTVTGTRLNDGSGLPGEVQVDVEYMPRFWYYNVLVTWLDNNYSDYATKVTVNIFDDNEHHKSYPWPLPCELNINIIDDFPWTQKKFTQIMWDKGVVGKCLNFLQDVPYPGNGNGWRPGFIRYHLPQVGPAGDGATAAGIFMNLVFSNWYPLDGMDGYWAPGSILTLLGHDVGKVGGGTAAQ